jgi:hypothetical protein
MVSGIQACPEFPWPIFRRLLLKKTAEYTSTVTLIITPSPTQCQNSEMHSGVTGCAKAVNGAMDASIRTFKIEV